MGFFSSQTRFGAFGIGLIYPEMLPEDISCSKEAKDVIVDCCVGESFDMFAMFASVSSDALNTRLLCVLISTEWVKLISTQSNSVCDNSSKKTISPEHVTEALKVCFAPTCLVSSISCLVAHLVGADQSSNLGSTTLWLRWKSQIRISSSLKRYAGLVT